MIKKAIYMTNNPGTIDKVYSDRVKNLLKTELAFPNEVINKKNLDAYASFLAETEYIFTTWGMTELSTDEINRYFPNLKVIFYAAGSVRYFAENFLNRGVKVSSAWVVNGYPVTELTISQILLAGKGYFRTVQTMKDSNSWREAAKTANLYDGNYNSKVGILGVGAIGSRVAQMLSPFDIELYAYDPYLSEEKAASLNVKKASLEYIFSTCDIVSNHIANIPQTIGMLDGKLFTLLKPNATFINTGRAQQLVESDFISMLKQRPDVTALIDVTDPEPPVAGSELYTLKNVFMTPHIAGCMNRECYRLSECMYEEYKLYESEGRLNYNVDIKMLENMA